MARLVNIFEFTVPAGARAAYAPLVKNRLLDMEKRIAPQMRIALENYMQDVVTETLATTELGSRSGELAKSLYDGIRTYGTKFSNIRGLYKGIGYARAHEEGAVIRPKQAEVLTLPLPAALRADGTPKLAGPRNWKRFGTFSYTSKKTGQGYLAYRKGDGTLVLLYVYVDMVTLKPKLGLRKTHNANIDQLMGAWLQIFAYETYNIDLMGIVNNPDRPAKSIKSAYIATKKFRPRAVPRRRGR